MDGTEWKTNHDGNVKIFDTVKQPLCAATERNSFEDELQMIKTLVKYVAYSKNVARRKLSTSISS